MAVSVRRAVDAVTPSRATAPGGTSPPCQDQTRSLRIVTSSPIPPSTCSRVTPAITWSGSVGGAEATASAVLWSRLGATTRSARPAPSGFSTAAVTSLPTLPNHSGFAATSSKESEPSFSSASIFWSTMRHQALPPTAKRPFAASAAPWTSVGRSEA